MYIEMPSARLWRNSLVNGIILMTPSHFQDESDVSDLIEALDALSSNETTPVKKKTCSAQRVNLSVSVKKKIFDR